ncbi:MAG: hypothetical protein KA099_07615 [Alphaproteobacteria bacterium]|nr:hypothetical protein [Alphaproteobacteria bacterium]MBP7757888.1 hypothetical protein [Alphaproteobacteria bacterium]MBP7761215.1 hypothetical protein [Alphaproteobacteria bacterium]MBP7905179.1 hypothetical protein [Alphaproteobacteria bacterium]
MLLNIKKFLKEAGITEALYPGKRLVKKCKIPGEYKSHSVIFDWRDPDKLRLEVKAGLTGKDPENKELRKYPVSLQTPTYVEIDTKSEKKSEDEEGEEGKSSGKSGGGGKQPKIKKLEEIEVIAARFGDSAEGRVPEQGSVTEVVVMGLQVAKEAFETIMSELAKQINHAVIATTELLAKAGELVTRVQPPSFLKPKGDETAKYKYDREKNADIGFRPTFG